MHTSGNRISPNTRRVLGGLFAVTAIVLLVANTALGNELIRALPGIMSNTDYGMPIYLSIMLMVAISLLEIMVFSGIIDIEDGVQGAIEHIVLWAIRVVLPFDVLGNVFGIIIGNAPISQATERVAGNLTRFIVIFASLEQGMPFGQKVEIIADGVVNFLITGAVLALAVLVGAGPEFLLGKYLKSQHPNFVKEMREALHISPATTARSVPGSVPAPVARPANNPANVPTARPANNPANVPTARPVNNPAPGRRPPMPGPGVTMVPGPQEDDHA